MKLKMEHPEWILLEHPDRIPKEDYK